MGLDPLGKLTDEEFTEQATKLEAKVGKIFERQHHGVMGAVLASLLIEWLMCVRVQGDEDATKEARQDLLDMHVGNVKRMVFGEE